MGPSSPNGPESHPGGERHKRNLDSNLAAIHPSNFLNERNTTDLQEEYALIYAGHNLYLPTLFFQSILQGHILVITDPYAPTGLSPLLTPPSSAGPGNAQQQAMRIQVLLLMGQDCLSKEEEGELLDHRVHIFTSTQDLRHSTRNFVKLVRNYLGE